MITLYSNIISQHADIIVPPYADVQTYGVGLCKQIEYAGRNCYASHDKITDKSYERFCRSLLKRGHESPFEFAELTFDITTSRAVLAEITRHRLCSFAVESQRYILEKDRIDFIEPSWYIEEADNADDKYYDMSYRWKMKIDDIAETYQSMVKAGGSAQEAREVLPNSTKTRIIMKTNIREWRHFFTLRCDKAAYPQMRELACIMLEQAHDFIPVVFDDLYDTYIGGDANATKEEN